MDQDLSSIMQAYARMAMFEDCNIQSPASPCPDGDTPFHMAVFGGDLVAVTRMLAGIDNINMQGDMGTTPLHYAVMKGHTEIARFLILHGADVHQKDDYGDTPMDGMRDDAAFRAIVESLHPKL